MLVLYEFCVDQHFSFTSFSFFCIFGRLVDIKSTDRRPHLVFASLYRSDGKTLSLHLITRNCTAVVLVDNLDTPSLGATRQNYWDKQGSNV